MRILSELRARLGARADSEHEQAAVRVVIVAILFLYVLIHAREETDGSGHALMLVALGGGYLAISLAIMAAIVVRPAPSRWRRILAMITDFSVLSGFMHLGGKAAAPFYAVYLWIALGNGFRYGLPYLAGSVALAAVGFSAVVLTSPFWMQEWALALGLLAALVILPGYAATLIRKLTEAKAQAEAASLAKTRFLAGVSHELRTPLNAIIGTSDLMGGTPLDADQREMVHTVKTAGTTLLALIDDILDVSRIEAERTVVDATDFDLHAALADVLAIFRPSAGERMLRLAAQVDPSVPWRLHGDARHFRQILTNLIGNALKFTQQGAIIVRAEPREAGGVRILVADTGIGIPAHLHERIFERFARADEDVNRRFGGTGLGLAISRSLAELGGGSLAVASKPGRGSTFCLEMPYPPARHPEALPPTLPRRILAVSDDPALLHDVRNRLRAHGIVVFTADSADAARAALSREVSTVAPLVVIVDARGEGNVAAATPGLRELAEQRIGATVFLRIGGPAPGLAIGAHDAAAEAGIFATLPWPPAEETLVGGLHAAACFAPGAGEHGDEAASADADAARKRRSEVRVLVAEDNPVNRKVTARLLERAGFQATLVESGEDALDALAQESFDTVLLDINMPGISGLDVVKLYRMGALDQPRIPIIALSADATVETKEAALAAGIDIYLTKPVEPGRLIATIEAAMAGGAPRPAKAGQAAAAEPARVDRRADTGTEEGKAVDEGKAAGSAGMSEAGEAEVLNPRALQALKAFSGPGEDFAFAILQDFIVNSEALLLQIGDAARATDALAFRAAVHALRGTAGNVGADALRRYCQELQGMSQERLRAHGTEYIARLERELARLRREVDRYGARAAAASPVPPSVQQRIAG